MRHFRCQCGNTLFFENTTCLQCGLLVGYDPEQGQLLALDAEGGKILCQNGTSFGACNWLTAGPQQTYCKACLLNRVVPDLSLPANLESWRRVESAKRRVLYTLLQLRIDPPRLADDATRGLAFDTLAPLDGSPVLTGYANGVITLNLKEADPAERERRRSQLGEPYRTLVGHFRHESAHYIWQQFFGGQSEDSLELRAFRELFGDERADYAAALQQHYASGAPVGWETEFISAYASVHPHEDWAECWAHYLHIVDGTETTEHFGINSKSVPIPFTRFSSDVAELPQGLELSKAEEKRFMEKLHSWAKLSPALNEVASSIGHEGIYPFVLSLKVAKKLCFVHRMVVARQG
ncbi:MAG: putative zinc-binding metallopeptidase [Verrucomicrobiae bacterium]|nr:putative zinc-binding metallopeptidase [Verrucomicrobiae bacterium]